MINASEPVVFPNPPGKCSSVVLLLPWFLNGTLDSDERDLVSSHLSDCEACREEMKETRDFARLLDTHVSTLELAAFAHGLLPTPAASSNVQAHLEVCSSCADELSMLLEADRSPGMLNSRPWPRWAVAAAAVVGVGLAVGLTQKAHIESLQSSRAQTVETRVPAAKSEVGGPIDQTAQLFMDGFESGKPDSWNGEDLTTFRTNGISETHDLKVN